MDYFEHYTKNQIDKLGNALIYICEKMEDLSKTHLLKLVFIIEEISVKNCGLPFFDLKFDLWKLGPVSKDLYVELTEELNLLSDYIEKVNINGVDYVKSKKQFSDDEFSDNELILLEEITKRFKYCTAKELINFTHKKNSPWYNTAVKHGILEPLELGKITTTEIEIKLDEIIADNPYKLALYYGHKEFLHQSKSLKL